MRIGFFGDSFCARADDGTYIDLLKKHYQAEVVNLGVGGSSIYDTVLLQLAPFTKSNDYPDVCVFVWSNIPRLFNRIIRDMNSASVNFSTNNSPEWNAAKQYFKYLYDEELEEIRYIASLKYFDELLSKIPNTTKIIHLWAFSNKSYTTGVDFHCWKSGVEIRPPLIHVSTFDHQNIDAKKIDTRPNHLDGNKKNYLVFNWIKNAIDNYNVGTLNNEEITL